jgi:hypothetical protein
MSAPVRTPRLALGLSSLALVGVMAAACASGGADPNATSDVASGVSTEKTFAPAAVPAGGDQMDAFGGTPDDGANLATLDRGAVTSEAARSYAETASTSRPPQPDSMSPLVIRTGAVSLKAEDVGDARFEVQKVVDQHAGDITEEETRTNDDGVIKTTRMVIRVPSADFARVMGQLEKVADLEMSTSSSEDVTTQVIDNKVRVQVQRRSIARIQTLLDRARSIRDIVRIETQLNRRQATLNSLLRRQSYLQDQTSLSTITVAIERTKKEDVAPVVHTRLDVDTTGFAAGLNSGWRQLTVAAVGLATIAGVSLPWLVVLLLLAPLVWFGSRPVVRRLRGPATEPEPEPTA